MHDMGMIAVTQIENGKEKRGFEVHVGGGLGAVPYQAKLFDSFVPPEELLPLAQSISRVFRAPRREKESQPRAHQIPGPGFGHREIQGTGPRRTQGSAGRSAVDRIRRGRRKIRRRLPLRPAGKAPLLGTESFQRWVKTNTRPQKQEGYTVVTIALPLGDITAEPAALIGGHRAPLHEGNDPTDRRAKYRPSLGQPERSPGIA